jgi:hypothetical protein
MVKLSPSASVGEVTPKATSVESSSKVKVVVPAVVGALLVGAGAIKDPPPPQAARVREARVGKARVLLFCFIVPGRSSILCFIISQIIIYHNNSKADLEFS